MNGRWDSPIKRRKKGRNKVGRRKVREKTNPRTFFSSGEQEATVIGHCEDFT